MIPVCKHSIKSNWSQFYYSSRAFVNWFTAIDPISCCEDIPKLKFIPPLRCISKTLSIHLRNASSLSKNVSTESSDPPGSFSGEFDREDDLIVRNLRVRKVMPFFRARSQQTFLGKIGDESVEVCLIPNLRETLTLQDILLQASLCEEKIIDRTLLKSF